MTREDIEIIFQAIKNRVKSCDTDKEALYQDQLISWLSGCAIRIWASNKYYAKGYEDALEFITGKKYTVSQIATALDCVYQEDRKIEVPQFFKIIVQNDVENNTNLSRELYRVIGIMLSRIALTNGDFTIEEATALREIYEMLQGYCDSQNVKPGQEMEYVPSMITPTSMTGYYLKPISQDAPEPVEINTDESKKPQLNLPELNITKKDDTLKVPEKEDTPTYTKTVFNNPEEKETAKSAPQPIKQQNTNNQPKETMESVLAELNGLVGLDKVKADVKSLMNFITVCQMRTQRNMKVPTVSYHLVFTGNPGTGKTTVARMIAKLYYYMGILPQGQLIETDRSGLVAGYVGQTAIKTQGVIKEALGGVLFIDEAYSLVNDDKDSFGKEAIETLLKAMEDHRDELVVIVAGYDELMHKFIDSNPGLRSRFNKYFHFPDYVGEDLFKIFLRFCETNGYVLAEDTRPQLQAACDKMFETREEHFGNARAIRNLFEHAIQHQADRLMTDDNITDAELAELNAEDISYGLEVM